MSYYFKENELSKVAILIKEGPIEQRATFYMNYFHLDLELKIEN
jgi:hypothetical protein